MGLLGEEEEEKQGAVNNSTCFEDFFFFKLKLNSINLGKMVNKVLLLTTKSLWDGIRYDYLTENLNTS